MSLPMIRNRPSGALPPQMCERSDEIIDVLKMNQHIPEPNQVSQIGMTNSATPKSTTPMVQINQEALKKSAHFRESSFENKLRNMRGQSLHSTALPKPKLTTLSRLFPRRAEQWSMGTALSVLANVQQLVSNQLAMSLLSVPLQPLREE